MATGPTTSNSFNPLRDLGNWASRQKNKVERGSKTDENFKIALNIVEDGLHDNDQQLVQSLRVIQKRAANVKKGWAFWQGDRYNKILKQIYYMAFPDDLQNPLNSKDSQFAPLREHNSHVQETARRTIEKIVDANVRNSSSADVKTLLFSKDDKAVLDSMRNLFNEMNMVQKNKDGGLKKFESWLQKLNKSKDQSFVEAEVAKMLDRTVGAGDNESEVLLRDLASRKILSFIDNQLDIHHSTLPEYGGENGDTGLRAKHADLVGLTREKVYDMAMRAVQEKCVCGAKHTGSIEKDFSELEVKPKGVMTGYMLLMLKAEPGSDEYRHAQNQVVRTIKDMGEQMWLIDDELTLLSNEKETLENKRSDGKGGELTLKKNSTGAFLTVDERIDQLEKRIEVLEIRQHKMTKRYVAEMESSNKFFEGLEELTGNDSIADLVRFEIFNATDEEGKENSLRQWFSIDSEFMKHSVEAQITGSAPKNGLVQARIINKLKAEYDEIHLEREQKTARLAELNSKRNEQEATLFNLGNFYSPLMNRSRMSDLSSAFKDLKKDNLRNFSAAKLSNQLEQTVKRHERLDELRAKLDLPLSSAQKAFIDFTLTGDVNRDDYQPLVNHLAKLQTTYKSVTGSEHVVEDLKEMTRLVREDREAYHQELALFGNAIVTEAETQGGLDSMQNLFNNHMGGTHINLDGYQIQIATEDFELNSLKEQLTTITETNIQINDLEIQLNTRLDHDQIFEDLTKRRDELAQAVPSLQANVMVMNLKESGLLTENNYENVVGSMLDDLDDFSLNNDGSGQAFVEALNSFVKFIAHYIAQAFAPQGEESSQNNSNGAGVQNMRERRKPPSLEQETIAA